MGLSADFQSYLSQLRFERKLSERTVDAYTRDLALLETLLEGQPYLQLQTAQARRLVARLHQRALNPRSIARILSGWRGFYQWLCEQDKLAANPLLGVRPPKIRKPLPEALSVDDAVRLVAGADVMHSFFVPSLAVQIYSVPGRLNETWFKANREGIYYGQCSELCGRDHAYMPIAVRVVSDKDYAAWLDQAKKKYAIDDRSNATTVIAAK